uniref:Uncharacterized protein n=1 Tax=Lactuca sativa TaxID=4236 RepID=A0A9R1WQW6_LACSA|nr:hypothetical protein LSAT_V11C100037810 [Lactuca sativa]
MILAYLSQIPCDKWTRSLCPTMRYGYLISNNAESINVVLKHARKLPILPLLEFFRTLIKKYNNTYESVSSVDNATYQVHEFKSGSIVDLRQKTCSCNYWQLIGCLVVM